MINISPTEKQLAAMTPPQRKQYVQMHKSNPYIVSMALNIDNLEKAIRLADQARNIPAEQPKVVDQFLAQMGNPSQPQMPPAQAQPMPEDVGIGALPAPNMQGMAGGGIVAFGDGGEVQRFAGLGDSLVRSTTGGKDYFLDVPETIRDPSVPFYRLVPNPMASLAGKKFATREEAARAYDTAAGTTAAAPVAIAPPVAVPAAAAPSVSAASPQQAPAAPLKKAAPAAPREPGIAGLKEAAAPTGMDYAEQYSALRGKLKDTDPYASLITERNRLAKEQGEARATEFEKDVAKDKDVYANREARLLKRDADITKQGETNTGLALLNAGLAIMSTPGGLATAIGKGARVGTEQFAAGLDKINQAKLQLQDAQDRADDLKLSREDMTKRERRQIKADINKDALAAQDLAIAGARDAGARNDKVAAAALEQTGAFQRTRMTTDATKAAAATTAGAAAGRLNLAEDRLALDALRLKAKTLQDQLKENPPYGKTKAKNAELQTALDNVNLQLQGGTIPAPSAAPAPGGTTSGKTIDFMTGKPI
jgi:hypothetical protein